MCTLPYTRPRCRLYKICSRTLKHCTAQRTATSITISSIPLPSELFWDSASPRFKPLMRAEKRSQKPLLWLITLPRSIRSHTDRGESTVWPDSAAAPTADASARASGSRHRNNPLVKRASPRGGYRRGEAQPTRARASGLGVREITSAFVAVARERRAFETVSSRRRTHARRALYTRSYAHVKKF